MIVGLVVSNRLLDPSVVFKDRFVPDGLAGHSEQISPLERPELGMLGPSQELIDKSSPLIGTRVCQECGSFVYRRQDPDHVEINPSQKYIVSA